MIRIAAVIVAKATVVDPFKFCTKIRQLLKLSVSYPSVSTFIESKFEFLHAAKFGSILTISTGGICGSALPSINTRVAYFIEWIESIVWPDNQVNAPLPL